MIKFEVHDQDLTCTDLVGTFEGKIFEVLGPNQGMTEWHTIMYNGKSAGKLSLETKWIGAEGQQPQGGVKEQANPYI